MSDSVLRDLDQARRGQRTQQPEDPLMRDLIGELLRRARTEQRRTLREVAEDAQVSLPYLSEIERGRKEASSEVLAAVYRSLGLSLTDVLAELYRRAAPIRITSRGSYQVAPMPQQAHPSQVTQATQSIQQVQQVQQVQQAQPTQQPQVLALAA